VCAGQPSAKETLRVMAADLVPGACVRIPVIGSGVEADAIAGVPRFSSAIDAALKAIAHHVTSRRPA
jgi:hypothetical protein